MSRSIKKGPSDARIGVEPLGHGQCVRAVALHAHAEGFQMHAHDPRIDWRRSGAEVAHELRGGLGDVCGLAEFLRVGDAMVGVVRSGEARTTDDACPSCGVKEW